MPKARIADGAGTRIVIEIPIAEARQDRLAVMSEDHALSAPTVVLVVDDEPQIQRFLKPSLEAAGYKPIDGGDAAPRPCGSSRRARPMSSCSISASPTWTART